MRRPPPLSTCLGYPITAGVAALAIAATLRWWSGANIDRFMIGLDDWWREPWRLLTPALFHVDVIHLLFNLYWLWVFGTQIEQEFGPGKTLGIYVLLALGSNTAEHAIFYGGVGLSGVVYGLFGLLWVLARKDPRFHDAVDRQTTQLLVGWFFLCIALTAANAWRVANVAHGTGCLLGAILGWTIAARPFGLQVRNAAILAAMLLLFVAGGTIARPYVSLSANLDQELAYLGYKALESNNPQRAVTFYEKAVRINPNVHDWWFNLAVAYQRLGRPDDALDAFKRAAALEPQHSEVNP